MAVVIDVQKVSKIYPSERGPVHAVSNFSMTVEEGDFVAIVGPSGCGKTTMLWGLTGLHPFSGGRAFVLGDEVQTPRKEVGSSFNRQTFFPGET